MSVVNFKDYIFGKKTREQQVQSTPTENLVTDIDDQIALHHQNIENHVSEATRESVQAGSSISAINTNPESPLSIIQGASQGDVMIDRQKEINVTTPDQYKSIKTPWGNAADRIIYNKEGLTDTKGLLSEQAKRDQAKAELMQQVQDDLKKAS
jgi:hypothetical protein